MINKKKALAVAVAAVLTAPMAAYAVKYSLSGQVTQALYLIDAGKQSDYQFSGAGMTGSRLELKGSHDIDNGMKVGFHWEVGHGLGGPKFKGDGGALGAPGIRYMNMSLSGGFGKLTLGQTASGNFGAPFSDLGGSAWMAFEASCDHATGVEFYKANGDRIGSAASTRVVTGTDGQTASSTVVAADWVTIGDTCPSYDGSRDAGLRYDSPSGTPVNFSFSVHNENKWGAMIKAGGDAPGGMTWDGRFGYGDSGSAETRWAASGGIKFPSGTSVNLMHGETDPGTAGSKETSGWVLKLAQQIDPSTTFTVGVRRHDLADAADSTSYGVGGTRTLGDSGATLVVGFQRHSLDIKDGDDPEDINLFYVATRVRFN